MVLVLNVRVHVGSLLGPITTVWTLKSWILAALVLKVPPQSVSLLVGLAAIFAHVTLRLLWKMLLLLLLLLAPTILLGGCFPIERLMEDQTLLQCRVFVPVCCKQVRKRNKRINFAICDKKNAHLAILSFADARACTVSLFRFLSFSLSLFYISSSSDRRLYSLQFAFVSMDCIKSQERQSN